METSIISTIILLVFIIAVWKSNYNDRQEEKKRNAQKQSVRLQPTVVEAPTVETPVKLSAKEVVECVLNDLHCEYCQFDYNDWGVGYDFSYQNGQFRLIANKDTEQVRLYYPGILDVDIDKKSVLAEVCKDFNYGNHAYKACYDFVAETDKLRLDLLADERVTGKLEVDMELLKNMFSYCFTHHRTIHDKYLNAIGSHNGLETREEQMREHYLQLLHETDHQQNKAISTEEPLTMLHLWSLTRERWLLNDPISMTLVSDVNRVVTDLAEIQRTNVVRMLMEQREKEGETKTEELVCLLKYKDEHVMIVVRLESENEADAVLSLSIVSNWKSQSENMDYDEDELPITLNIVYDKRTEKQRHAEFVYMADETEETDTPNLVQQEIQGQTDKPWAESLYWGTKAFLDGAAGRAIFYLERVYQEMEKELGNLSEREKDSFNRVMYRLGYCYNELGLFKQAYYYLEQVFRTDSLEWNMEHVNALVNGSDWRAEMAINSEKESMLQWLNEHEEHEMRDAVVDYMIFLDRRKVFIMIEQGRLEEAKSLLIEMVKYEAFEDYARQELRYIAELENGGKKQPKWMRKRMKKSF